MRRNSAMKKKSHLPFYFLLALLIVSGLFKTSVGEVTANVPIQGRNVISGTVFGESNRPVSDIYVELLDDMNSAIRRVKTDGTGRFEFNGLANGRYIIKALSFGTDYLDQLQEVTLGTISSVLGSGSDRQHVQIYLRVNERANVTPFSTGPGVIFAQEVPEEARRMYQEGLVYLRGERGEDGLERLKKAIEIFPKYYLALDRLGAEYAIRGMKDRAYYEAGLVLLSNAVEVNPRGFQSLFGLGWTQYQLGMNNEAISSLRRATSLYNRTAEPFLWLGKALHKTGAIDQAEEALLRAKSLARGKSPDVHWQLAGLYSELKRYKEAADEFELFLKAEPDAADAEKIRALIKQLRQKAEGS